MILTRAQAVACVYAMDTSALYAHITIGSDIDVQKLPGGQVTVEMGPHASEYYSSVFDFVAAYRLPMPAKPLQEVAEELEARDSAEAISRKFWKCVGVVAVVGILITLGVVYA